MKLIMENWRKFVNEQKPSNLTGKKPKDVMSMSKAYASGQAKIKALLDKWDNYVWIYYDTETTGLKHAAPTFQVTQWGAIAIDYGVGFSNWTETKDSKGNTLDLKLDDGAVVGKFNPMQELDPGVEKAIPIQEEDKRELRLLLMIDVDEKGEIKLEPSIGKDGKPTGMTIPALIENPPPIYVIKSGKVVGERPKGKEGVDYKVLTGDEFELKLNIVEDILSKYVSEETAKKLTNARPSSPRGSANWFRTYSAILYKNFVDFNIANALEMTRYFGREEYKTRRENLIGFAKFIKQAEEKTGNKAFIVAHNMLYDRKALLAELELAKKKTGDSANVEADTDLMNAISYLTGKFTAQETLDGSCGDPATICTIPIFRQALLPVVEAIKEKAKKYGVETALEAQLLANLDRGKTAKGKNRFTVSLGPITQGFKIPDEGWHDALADVIMTSKMLARVIAFIQSGQEKVDEPIQGQLPAEYKDCPEGTYPVGDQCVDIDDENRPDFLDREKAGLTPRPERDPRQFKLPL